MVTMQDTQCPPEENKDLYKERPGEDHPTQVSAQLARTRASEPVDNSMGMRLSRHLAELPGLAARTAPTPRDRDDHNGSDARFIRPVAGPRLPPGLDLAAIDRDLHRQHSADQLARLGQCIRVVAEECDAETWRGFPDLAVEGEETWDSETSWLLATMSWWTTDAWCCEWIGTEVETIRATLIERIERASGWTTCALCGGTIESWSSETLDVAECRRCDRVVSMREREALTTAEAARRLGISEAAVRKRIERGELRKVGRRGKQSLVTPTDGLDWARRKLGLIGDLSAS